MTIPNRRNLSDFVGYKCGGKDGGNSSGGRNTRLDIDEVEAETQDVQSFGAYTVTPRSRNTYLLHVLLFCIDLVFIMHLIHVITY
ncbi:hypothetical protein M6B38_357880 [Iris pallida]|uniref:Uncharacterized protein n=1 Tax=Iris pallida TaxID=29817 RepID=A0AAX6GLI3_IRIPA|nr:hypothetical protein M6B38_357880 [Iris pallida]